MREYHGVKKSYYLLIREIASKKSTSEESLTWSEVLFYFFSTSVKKDGSTDEQILENVPGHRGAEDQVFLKTKICLLTGMQVH